MDGPPVSNHNHTERAPPSAGTFIVNNVQPFITAATIDYLHTIPAGERWVNMVSSYLRLEGYPVVTGVSTNLSLNLYLLLMRP